MVKNFLQKLVPVIDVSKVFSWKNPLVWFMILTLILLVYIITGNHNEKLFLSIFNLTGSHQLLDSIMKFNAAYLFIVIALIVFLWMLLTQKGNYVKVGVSYILVGIIAYIFAKIGSHFILDTRPYIEYHLTPLISVAKDNGFPSDHTLLVSAIASVTPLYSKAMGWLLFLLAFLVAFARIYVAAHHPLDVIGSMVIVVIALMLFIGISKLVRKF